MLKNGGTLVVNESGKKKGKDKKGGTVPQFVFIILLLIYFGSNVAINLISRSEGTIPFMGGRISLSAFTGVFSSIGNICIIFMVVFFGKLGFITSIALTCIQFPLVIIQFFSAHNAMAMPAVFSGILTIITVILIYKRNRSIEKYQNSELDHLREQQRFSQSLFEQTATALVNAIDAKDTYSHGHSMRVAEYSRKIAEMSGKDEEECYKIYYAALLHDVGKIGIQNAILNKKGKLTGEEYDIIKTHPVMGNQILSSISEYPYLSIGAHYHHERYDGKGYPEGLKGDDIPEIARIISVADAYDAMSSNRSYREAIPQQLVREEIVKGAGTQFDPTFARIMQHLIDLDVEYRMKERVANKDLAKKGDLKCGEFRANITEGILITPFITKLHFRCNLLKNPKDARGTAFVLFDSLDGRAHSEEKSIKEMNYSEYCVVWMNGRTENSDVRKIQTQISKHAPDIDKFRELNGSKVYDVEAVKRKDHAMIKIDDGETLVQVIIALPDASRYVYLGITGEYCEMTEGSIERASTPISDDYIPRIAEKISYLNGPEGDVPSVQVDGHRTDATQGIPINGSMQISFHTMSLPTARLIWHCPYFDIFTSDDGIVRGKNYHGYALLRMDGENIRSEEMASNEIEVEKKDSFLGWNYWKDKNKEGLDVTVNIERKGNTIIFSTENLGVYMKNITTVESDNKDIYFALTGDQCALTNIRIKK